MSGLNDLVLLFYFILLLISFSLPVVFGEAILKRGAGRNGIIIVNKLGA
jgi:hypothetical protein